jgi:hypothetical protein
MNHASYLLHAKHKFCGVPIYNVFIFYLDPCDLALVVIN